MVGMIAAKYKTVDGTVINAYPIQYIGGTNSANNTLAFGSSNGATIIGAGEGGKHIYVTNSNVADSESLYLAADDQISAYCGCANDGSGATHVFASSKTSSTFFVPLYAPTAAAGTKTTQVATTAFVDTAVSTSVAKYLPLTGVTGMVAFFATAKAPSGWLICDGSAVSRTTYAALFAAIGTTYGKGNGSTTFNLPNMINRFAEGAKTGVGGTVDAGLPNITGSIWAARTGRGDAPETAASGAFTEASKWNASVHQGGSDDWGSEYALDASRSSSIYGKSTTVQPPAVKLLPCIHI